MPTQLEDVIRSSSAPRRLLGLAAVLSLSLGLSPGLGPENPDGLAQALSDAQPPNPVSIPAFGLEEEVARPTGDDAEAIGAWVDRVLAGLDERDQNDPFAIIDACMRQEVSDRGAAGASLAIAQDGRLVHASATGVKSRSEGGDVDTDTMFRINSTTKMMTGAVVLQEVEKGNLDLQAPITEYIPDLRLLEPWDPSTLTLHDLLSNTGGLPDPYVDFSLYPHTVQIPSWDKSIEEWASLLQYAPLYAPSGSFWNYSSPNFSVAGLALERKTGRGYSEYVTNELWRKAGMIKTTFSPDEAVATGNYSAGYYQGRSYTLFDFDRPYAHPGGGAYSTPSELIQWATVLFGQHGDVLSNESIEAMTTPWVESEGSPSSPMTHYGYGIWLDDYRSLNGEGPQVTVLEHSGRGRGFATEFHWIPERGFAIAILVNEVASMLNTARCALRELEGLQIAPDPGLNTPASTWGRYEGSYSMVDIYGDTWTTRISREDGGMKIGFPDLAMLPATAAPYSPKPMTHRFLDSFRYEAAQGGNVTFEHADPPEPHTRWMRSQYRVAQRVGELPESISIEGDECSPIDFRSGLDTTQLSIRAYGLSEVFQARDQIVRPDDPDDPSSATLRYDLESLGDIGFISAWVAPENDDRIDALLMQDRDGNGSFDWPEELVDRSSSSPTNGLSVAASAEPGPYQLWVHGTAVQGANSRFDLDALLLAGDDLRLFDAPEEAEAGQALSFEVCGPEGRPYESPRSGIVEFDFGVPPGIVRVPVDWRPGAAEPTSEPTSPSILLPRLARERR